MVSPRPLSFRDRFVWELEQVVSSIFDDCEGLVDPYIFPDMTTRVPLVLYLSQEQFTTLYSAVLTGADLSYPNTSHDVENLFLQMVNCSMSELCQAIADCILESENTQTALLQFLSDNGIPAQGGNPIGPVSPGILGANLLPAGYVCSDDNAFGMSLAIVDSINAAVTEVLQAIEIMTNPLELAAELGDNIPGVGALATGADVAAWIQDTAKEAYDLAWSTVIRDALACDLWCEFKGDCELSFDSVWNVYLQGAEVSPPSSLFLSDWLVWLMALPLTAAKSTVSTISLLGLLAMRYGGKFGEFALGIRSLETVILLSEDETSNNWSVVCTTCPDWEHTFDFTVDQQGWYQDTGWATGAKRGVYVPDVGWESDIKLTAGVNETCIDIAQIEFATTVIRRFTLNYTGAVAGLWTRGFIDSQLVYTDDLIASNELVAYDPATPPSSITWVGSQSCVGLAFVQWNSRCFEDETIGLQQVVSITLEGEGTNPFL